MEVLLYCKYKTNYAAHRVARSPIFSDFRQSDYFLWPKSGECLTKRLDHENNKQGCKARFGTQTEKTGETPQYAANESAQNRDMVCAAFDCRAAIRVWLLLAACFRAGWHAFTGRRNAVCQSAAGRNAAGGDNGTRRRNAEPAGYAYADAFTGRGTHPHTRTASFSGADVRIGNNCHS